MKITHILKTMIKYKIITSSDFYFSTILFNNQTLKIKFLALCINHFIHNGHICLPSVLIEQKKVFLTNKINLINKLWSLIQINKNFWINELLKDSHIISNGLKKTPLIFNNKNFYTYKLWLAEKKIWKFINQNQNIQTNNTNIIKKLLKNSLKEDTDLTQKIAITLSMISNIIFIIGGPGTGKTTIISKIILIFIKLFSRNVKIKLTALTGKASNNLTESINKNIKKFNITNEKINIPDYKATTLHKLLNIKYENKIKITNTKIDLSNIDLLIIDEASMIDIEIMEKLIDNIPITLKVIFIGDHNQLPSISGGHILKDICSYYREGFSKTMTNFLETLLNKQKIIKTIKNYKFSNINDKIIMLKKNYRCNLNSDILNFSNILKKNSINNKKILYNNTYQDIKFKNIFHNLEYKKIISQLAKIYKKYWLILKKKNH